MIWNGINCRQFKFLNDFEMTCLHTSFAIVFMQLNGFNYGYFALIILFNIIHLFTDSKVVTSISI